MNSVGGMNYAGSLSPKVSSFCLHIFTCSTLDGTFLPLMDWIFPVLEDVIFPCTLKFQTMLSH